MTGVMDGAPMPGVAGLRLPEPGGVADPNAGTWWEVGPVEGDVDEEVWTVQARQGGVWLDGVRIPAHDLALALLAAHAWCTAPAPGTAAQGVGGIAEGVSLAELLETVELVRRDLSTKLLGADGQSRVSESLKAVQHVLHDLYAQEPARVRTRQMAAEAFMASRVVISTREEWIPPLPAEAYAMADVALRALPQVVNTTNEARDSASLEQVTEVGAIVEDARGVVVKRVPASEEGPDFVWQCGLWDFPESTRDIAHLLTWPVTIIRAGNEKVAAAKDLSSPGEAASGRR